MATSGQDYRLVKADLQTTLNGVDVKVAEGLQGIAVLEFAEDCDATRMGALIGELRSRGLTALVYDLTNASPATVREVVPMSEALALHGLGRVYVGLRERSGLERDYWRDVSGNVVGSIDEAVETVKRNTASAQAR